MSSSTPSTLARCKSSMLTLARLLKSDSSTSILPFIPKPVRYLLLLLFLVNGRSFPFAWHIRYFVPILWLRIKWWSMRFSSFQTKDKWLDSFQPVGKSTFSLESTYSGWASIDESDFNMHLSNSSYAKTLDGVRVKFALEFLLPFFREGGWIALGGTHFSYLREIPIGASYEVRSCIGSWDGKWMYLISRFVSKSKRATAALDKTKQRITTAQNRLQGEFSASASQGEMDSAIPNISIHTQANDDASGASGSSTPAVPALASTLNIVTNNYDKRDNDEVLHCLAISEVCFKIGRITVPPALVLACSGVGIPADKWEKLKNLQSRPQLPRSSGGQRRPAGPRMREILKGAWKDLPADNRWWENALAADETERLRRLEQLGKLRSGMDGARSI